MGRPATTRLRNRLALLVLVLACLAAATTAQPDATLADLTPRRIMDRATATGRVHVIVELGGAASVPEALLPHAAAVVGQRQSIRQAQTDVRRALAGVTHRVHREYVTLPYIALEATPDALRMLGAMRGLVTRIDEDLVLRRTLGESGPLVQAPAAWATGHDGTGTVIAIVDDGVDGDHPFLSGKVVEEACFVRDPDGFPGVGDCPNGLDSQVGPGSGRPCSPFDCTHGTHVAGIAVGNGAPPAGVGLSGVARGADLMSVRVADASGSSSVSDLVAGLERVYLLRGIYNFAAANLSLGVRDLPQFTTCNGLIPAMTTIVENLRTAGIATVIASGNDGFTNAISFPACIGAAISVASSDDGSLGTTLNRVSSYSNVAPFVSLIAPGQWITSSYPGGIYETIRGTSMAAPHVAGALALLRQAAPAATVTERLAALRNTGAPTSDVPSGQRPGGRGTVLPQIRLAGALAALGSIRFESAAYSTNEAETATITVTRTGVMSGVATIDYATSNGTATSGTHYVATSGTLTFGPGEFSRTFQVAVIDNTFVNPARTVNLRLSRPTGATLGSLSTAVLAIENDDEAGVITLGAAQLEGAEDAGGITLEVVRAGVNLAGGVTVRFATANGTAIAGSDYTATAGTLSFPPGVATRTFTVPILNDTLLEGDRTFQVTLSAPTGGATLGAPTTRSVTIRENDSAGTVQFSAATYRIAEGAGSATVAVTRTGTSLAGGIRVGYSVAAGSATAGADFAATSGALTFAAGVTSLTFTVAVVNDALFEPDETVNLALHVPAGSAAVLGAPATAVLTIEDNDAPRLQFALATQSVAEGSTARVLVSRVGGLNAAVTAPYEVAGGTATGGGVDFTLAAGSVAFAAGQASATILLPTVSDTLFEGPETVVLRLLPPTGGAGLGTPVTTLVTITDDDTPGTVQFAAASVSVAENVPAGAVDLRVVRTGTNLASGITVDYAVTAATATNGADYVLANGTLTFAAGQTTATIPVTILDDGAAEGSETVVVTLSTAPGSAALGPTRVVTLTILDDEQALTFGAEAYRVVEGVASIAIPIVRSGPTPAGTTVTCRTVPGGSAIPDVDYRPVDVTLTFAAGSRLVTCVVPVLNDTVARDPRTVHLALVAPPGSAGQVGAPATVVLTIDDNDQGGVIRFGAATYTVTEGGTATLTVMRSGVNLASDVTVDYAVAGGSALGGGVDYTLAAGTLAFGAGVTSRTIPVPTVNDTLAEGPETVVVTLGNPTGRASLGVPAATTLTITDNDNGGTIQFSTAAFSVAENAPAGAVSLVVTRAGASLASDITVEYAVTGGTAIGGVDYTLADGALTFAAGQTSLTIPVLIHDDDAPEGNETVVVTLRNPRAPAVLGALRAATLTILDDEQAVTFGAPTYSVTEGTATAAIPILRSGPTPAGTTVRCRTTDDGFAVPGSDYRPVDTVLAFGAGARSVVCPVPIVNNTVLDGARTVNLALSIPAGSPGLLGSLSRTELTIQDNDQGGTFRFGAATYTVAEGSTASVVVMRAGTNLASGISVDYAVTGGSAENGVDYHLANGTLTFNAGQTTATIPIPTVNDTLAEGAEQIVLALGNPTIGAVLGTPAVTTLTITDNDNPGTVQFGSAAYSVAENAPSGVAYVVVTRTGPNLASDITVDYAVTGGTATGGGADYTLDGGTLTFAAGQTSASIPVFIHDDTEAEVNETVVIALARSTVNPATLGTVRTTTLTLVDDEQTLSFTAPAYVVTEGTATLTVPIVRQGPTPAGTRVGCQTMGGSAVPDVDYRPVDTELTFAAGARTVNCVVPILNNTVVDGSRSIYLGMAVLPGGSVLPGPYTFAQLTVHDNDQGGTIRFGAAAYTIAEGTPAFLTVTRSGVNLASGVTVDYAVTGGSAVNGQDFSLANGTLTFGVGQTTATIPVLTFSDSRFDGDQTVVVQLASPTPGATLGAPASTTLTIRDTTRPAQVRFFNDLVICNPCRSFTARLRAEEGYTWQASSGAASGYQSVKHARLSNFVVEALGYQVSAFFPGSFSITANRRYILVLTLNSSNTPVLLQFDEGPSSATLPAPAVTGSAIGSLTSEGLGTLRTLPLAPWHQTTVPW